MAAKRKGEGPKIGRIGHNKKKWQDLAGNGTIWALTNYHYKFFRVHKKEDFLAVNRHKKNRGTALKI
jgi:hypothetical protein